MRGNILILTVAVALISIIYTAEGAIGAGCKKGYCWAYCSRFNDLWDWCYTSGGDNKDSKGYAKCTGEGGGQGEYVGKTGRLECSAHWKCKGACALF